MTETAEERWQRNYREGEEARQRLTAYLIERGHEVQAPQQYSRPDWNVRMKFSDKGDININTPDGWRRVEVKRNGRWRSGPVPGRYVILGKPYRLLQPVDGAHPLLCIVIMATTLDRMLSVPAESRPRWYESSGVSTRSGQQGNKDVAVLIDIEHVNERWYRSF